MRRESQDKVEQNTPVEEPSALIPTDIDQPLPDWRELGRRVLSESMRRSARDLRRRNGSSSFMGHLRIAPGSRS